MPNRLDQIQPLRLEGWPLGVQNRPSELDQPPGSARIIANCDLFSAGNVRRRAGINQVAGWKGGHSAWTDSNGRGWYVTVDGAIQIIVNAEDVRTAGPQVNAAKLMSWCEFDSRIYYSNGIERGYIEGYVWHPWGIETPPMPKVSIPVEDCSERILVAQTAIYNNGEESGASLFAQAKPGSEITAPTGGGADAFDIYCSYKDGTELYHLATLPPGGSVTHGENAYQGRPLGGRVDKQRMPAGHIIERFKRRILSAVGRILYWSEVEQSSLCDMRHNWYLFDHAITAVIPMEDGCYLGLGDRLVWAQGADPEDWLFTERRNEGIIPQANAHYFKNDLLPAEGVGPGPLSMCWTADGECLALRNGGAVVDVAPLYAAPPYAQAVYGYREIDGLRQILTAFSGVQGPALGRYRG